jgi:hypothetical protein
MHTFECLHLYFLGSKGYKSQGDTDAISWDSVRLIITENGVSKVQNLAGGLDRIEEHLTNYLNIYNQQGWRTLKVLRPEGKSIDEENYLNEKKIMCILERSDSVPKDNNLYLAKNSKPLHYGKQ